MRSERNVRIMIWRAIRKSIKKEEILSRPHMHAIEDSRPKNQEI